MHSSWSPCKSRPQSNHHRVFPCLHLSLIVSSVQDPYIFPSVCLAYFSVCPLICPFVGVTWEWGSDREEIASPLLPSSPANTGCRFQRADAPELLARRRRDFPKLFKPSCERPEQPRADSPSFLMSSGSSVPSLYHPQAAVRAGGGLPAPDCRAGWKIAAEALQRRIPENDAA